MRKTVIAISSTSDSRAFLRISVPRGSKRCFMLPLPPQAHVLPRIAAGGTARRHDDGGIVLLDNQRSGLRLRGEVAPVQHRDL